MQFLSVDPLVDQTGQPYAYTADSPLNMVDPTGLKGCNGAQWQGWARLGSAVGDLFCNAGEVKDTLLTGRSNGTTDALVNEGQSLIFGPATVAGGPSSACEYPAYYAQTASEQQALNTQAQNAAIVSLAVGGVGIARGAVGFASGFVRGVRGLRAPASDLGETASGAAYRFMPLAKTVDRHGFFTNGIYRIDRAGMLPHLPMSAGLGKGIFLSNVDAESAVLDAAQYADENGLWVGNKAKVFVENGPVGVLGRTGERTSWINIYRTKTGLVHGSPGSAP